MHFLYFVQFWNKTYFLFACLLYVVCDTNSILAFLYLMNMGIQRSRPYVWCLSMQKHVVGCIIRTCNMNKLKILTCDFLKFCFKMKEKFYLEIWILTCFSWPDISMFKRSGQGEISFWHADLVSWGGPAWPLPWG